MENKENKNKIFNQGDDKFCKRFKLSNEFLIASNINNYYFY